MVFNENKIGLGFKDDLGFKFEMSNLSVLKQYKYGKYVKYANPKNPYQWKRRIGLGVDLVLKIGNYTLYVEESFCAHDYAYRSAWFTNCRLTRFAQYPIGDTFHKRIVLTNRPENFNSVKQIAQQNSVLIFNIDNLLTLINTLTTTITNQNNVYAYDRELIKWVYSLLNRQEKRRLPISALLPEWYS